MLKPMTAKDKAEELIYKHRMISCHSKMSKEHYLIVNEIIGEWKSPEWITRMDRY